jgi:hypothetical protein
MSNCARSLLRTARPDPETLRPPPARLGVTHWSSRLLAKRLKLDHATVLKALRSFGVTPWRAERACQMVCVRA